jgi:hypothetical protein
LSFDHLTIRDVEGERRIGAERLPLRVGTGSDCELRLPGPGGGPVMLLDLLDGVPFVQPVGRDAVLQINGEPLIASSRLNDQDELQFFGSRILVSAADNRLVLDVRLEDSAYVTQPPESPDDAHAGEDEAIAPTAFRRAAETRAAVVETHRSPLKAIVGSALGILLVASYLLFTSKSIQFDVEPAEPDGISISGGWFRMPIGDRHLMRKGEYVVNVEKQGYYDVSQSPGGRRPVRARRAATRRAQCLRSGRTLSAIRRCRQCTGARQVRRAACPARATLVKRRAYVGASWRRDIRG